MNILMLAPAFSPAIGGAETYAKVISENLEKRGHKCTIVTDAVSGHSENEDNLYRSSKPRVLMGDSSKLLWEQMYFSLNSAIEDVIQVTCVPDIIFANSHETAIVGSMIGDSYGIPVVACFHEQSPERSAAGIGRLRLVYEKLDLSAVIAGSRFYYDKALKYGSKESRTHLIRHGIDTHNFSVTNLVQQRPEPVTILLSGRIAPRKNQVFMVEVFQKLHSQFDIELILAGSVHSSSLEYFDLLSQSIADSNLKNITIMTGVGHDEMSGLYREADIVVQPSTEEGLGLAVLEAMSSGKPVVVSDIKGLREVVTSVRVGVRLPPGDVDAWSESIAYLIKNPDLRQRLGANAREYVVEHYSEKAMMDKTELLLQSIVDSWAQRKGV